jgi:putative hemolysin
MGARLKVRTPGLDEDAFDPWCEQGGLALALLWQGLAGFMRQHENACLFGCASVPLSDAGAAAGAFWWQVAPAHLAPEPYRVAPRHPLVLRSNNEDNANPQVMARPQIPPLLRAYLRVGAWVGGAPAWDPDFNCADFFIPLPLARMSARHARHCLTAA